MVDIERYDIGVKSIFKKYKTESANWSKHNILITEVITESRYTLYPLNLIILNIHHIEAQQLRSPLAFLNLQ